MIYVEKRHKLLVSKIQVPELQRNFVERERLLKMLDSGREKMVILYGTVGYGKTVLMTQYAHLCGGLCAWYHLDEIDNDIIIFTQYLCEALKKIWDKFELNIEDYLGITDKIILYQKIAMEIAIQINMELEREGIQKKKIVIMLDDFQTINSEDIFSFLFFLVKYTKGNLKIIFATKGSIPSFAMKFLLNDEARIIEMEELSFTEEEVTAVLKQVTGQEEMIRISPTVYCKVEGWPAGTMFVAQYLKQAGCRPDQIDWKSIDDEALIQNYIMYELYKNLSFDIQQFLVQTSVLDEISVNLCNSALNITNARSNLNYLLQENLFILRINKGTGNYRYHSIFKLFLEKYIFPEQRKEILERAARYYLKEGDTVRAIGYYIRNDNFNDMVKEFERTAEPLILQGQLVADKWIGFLKAWEPRQELSSRTCYLIARYYMEQKDYKQAGAYIKKALQKEQNQDNVRLNKEIKEKINKISIKAYRKVPIKVVCFGAFRVYLGDKEQEMFWRTKKTAELFAFLVDRNGKPIKRNELLSIMWPEEYPNNAVAMLHNMIYNIRKELASYDLNHLIQYENREYSMDVTLVSTDRDKIVKLCDAVDKKDLKYLMKNEAFYNTYWGTYLSDIENEWCDYKKHYYEKNYIEGCRLMAESYMRDGSYSQAVSLLKSGLYRDQYSEEMAVMLLNCYTRQRDVAAGKKLYENICLLLKEDLKVRPWVKLTEAYQECIRG